MPYKFKGKRDCKQSDGTNGKYLTIKKDGSRRCYQSKKQYKASQAWAHEADGVVGMKEVYTEDDAVNEFRQYVREILANDRPTPSPLKENKIYNTFSAGTPMPMQSRADPEFARLIKSRPIDEQYIDVKIVDESNIRKQIRRQIMEIFGIPGELNDIGSALGIGGGGESETSIMDDTNSLLSDLFPSAGEAEVDIEEIPKEEETVEAVESSIGAHLMAKLKAKGALGLEGGGVDDDAVADAVDELKSEIDDIAAGLS
jgi:hypothetical protein